MNKYLKYGIMGVIAVGFSAILFRPSSPTEEVKTTALRTYQEIVDSGVLHAVTEYNSISFHADGDTVGGLHYELLQAFAQAKGLQVDVTPEMSAEKRIEGIYDGTYDLLANNELISGSREDSLLFTRPLFLSKQVLVQRKPQSANDTAYIRSLLDLAHRTLHVVKGSPYIHRIRNLSNEIADTIYIQEIELYGPEQLVAMVASKDIDYAVCDEAIAQVAAEGLPQIDLQTAVSFTQFYSWGVNQENTALLDTLNVWIEQYKQTPAFQALMKKYSTN